MPLHLPILCFHTVQSSGHQSNLGTKQCNHTEADHQQTKNPVLCPRLQDDEETMSLALVVIQESKLTRSPHVFKGLVYPKEPQPDLPRLLLLKSEGHVSFLAHNIRRCATKAANTQTPLNFN